jgi:hypothetical protein
LVAWGHSKRIVYLEATCTPNKVEHDSP